MARKFGMAFFVGLFLVQGFFWVLIFAPIRSPVTWNPEYPPRIRLGKQGALWSAWKRCMVTALQEQVKMENAYHKPDERTLQALQDIATKLRIHSIESTNAAGSGYVFN